MLKMSQMVRNLFEPNNLEGNMVVIEMNVDYGNTGGSYRFLMLNGKLYATDDFSGTKIDGAEVSLLEDVINEISDNMYIDINELVRENKDSIEVYNIQDEAQDEGYDNVYDFLEDYFPFDFADLENNENRFEFNESNQSNHFDGLTIQDAIHKLNAMNEAKDFTLNEDTNTLDNLNRCPNCGAQADYRKEKQDDFIIYKCNYCDSILYREKENQYNTSTDKNSNTKNIEQPAEKEVKEIKNTTEIPKADSTKNTDYQCTINTKATLWDFKIILLKYGYTIQEYDKNKGILRADNGGFFKGKTQEITVKNEGKYREAFLKIVNTKEKKKAGEILQELVVQCEKISTLYNAPKSAYENHSITCKKCGWKFRFDAGDPNDIRVVRCPQCSVKYKIDFNNRDKAEEY